MKKTPLLALLAAVITPGVGMLVSTNAKPVRLNAQKPAVERKSVTIKKEQKERRKDLPISKPVPVQEEGYSSFEGIEEAALLCTQNPGTYGRLVIPDTGINVAVYAADADAAQGVTDAGDSAAYFTYLGGEIIADHTNQGFAGIRQAVPGETMAYVGNESGRIVKYVCTKKFDGHNTEYSITDADYNRIEESNPGGLIMYTCNECWQNVTVTFWQPV